MRATHTRRCALVGGLLLMVGSSPVQAAENMQFRGTLLTPAPCTLNGGQRIDVDFGASLGVNTVDGINYRQTVDYQLVCEPGASGKTLGLTLTGPAAAYDTATLQTSQAGLGIRLTLGGQPFRLATRVLIEASAPPVLQAVPVKAPDATLTEGAFEVLATLLADYQ
ncbi:MULTISPECIES: fimbrial protein [Serratia]|uniref:fimbrial protein n=1 Tax=Serratia TaxID=613 RepID=UPI001F4BCFA7|nr:MULTISPECIES: fimbrial protein [Serratia]ULG10887.1 pilus assembly protein [Serratia entomophila]CAI1948980.1 putative minor fimbrial subunit StfF [Serratia quinivorans]CAI2158815.1 putative minor fimbrial subunit StfF [Serratia quinivorans]